MPKKTSFFIEALKDFKRVGSFFPSQPALIKKIVRLVKPVNGMVIVELGAGKGPITKALLEKMPAKSVLLVFEVKEEFADYIQRNVKDKRVRVICDDARNAGKYLKEMKLGGADYVVSAIPMGTSNARENLQLLLAIKKMLKAGGVYIQFQYLLSSWREVKKVFGKSKIVSFVANNVPPAFIYQCVKERSESAV